MKSCNPMHSLQPRDPGGNHMRKMPRWHMQMDIMCMCMCMCPGARPGGAQAGALSRADGRHARALRQVRRPGQAPQAAAAWRAAAARPAPRHPRRRADARRPSRQPPCPPHRPVVLRPSGGGAARRRRHGTVHGVHAPLPAGGHASPPQRRLRLRSRPPARRCSRRGRRRQRAGGGGGGGPLRAPAAHQARCAARTRPQHAHRALGRPRAHAARHGQQPTARPGGRRAISGQPRAWPPWLGPAVVRGDFPPLSANQRVSHSCPMSCHTRFTAQMCTSTSPYIVS